MKNKLENGIYVHTLKKTFSHEGKDYSEIIFNFGDLTGKDYIAVCDEIQQLGKISSVSEFDGEFLAKISARAGKVPYTLLCDMPLLECFKITGMARLFLLGLGAEIPDTGSDLIPTV